MNIKKLPIEIQSLLNASAKINTYKKAIEELVYNSLDADATSVAIRIHIYDNFIQVIDNGFGIAKCDILLLGQKYTTSKITDGSVLRSAPKKYGFHGEFLSNVIEVSQSVKITTRHEETNETWVKYFYKGRHKDSYITTMRPSKGTTVEIKGFLYNLHIQKSSINSFNELQEIKLFLQQVSLVNTNVSISLRDNSKNDILFKIHKNRDIYQTLSSLFNINEKELQELQVEKNQYKVKGFIGKQEPGNGKPNSYRWIYLNGRFVHKNALHGIVNANFMKYKPNKQRIKNAKPVKNNFHDVEMIIQSNANEIPSYFLFISCPHFVYDINITSVKSFIEFKDWSEINKLLEKIVKFYKGDVNLREIDMKQTEKKKKLENTREDVRKIMEKILGTKSKDQMITQLQKGVKGKIIKKKIKNKTNSHKRVKKHRTTRIEKAESDHHSTVPKEKPPPVVEKITMCDKLLEAISNENINSIPRVEKRKELSRRPLNSRKERQDNKVKQYIDPKIKQYMKERKLENHRYRLYSEHLRKMIENKINKKTTKNPHECNGNELIFENKNKPSINENKKMSLKANNNIIMPLNIVDKKYFKSCDLLKTILNTQKGDSSYIRKDTSHLFNTYKQPKKICSSYIENEITHLQNVPSRKRYGYFIKKDTTNLQNVYKSSAKDYRFYFKENSTHLENINEPSEKDCNYYIGRDTVQFQNTKEPFKKGYSCYIGKDTARFHNIDESSDKGYSCYIEEDTVHIRNIHKPSACLDQCYRSNKEITYVNNMASNISTTHNSILSPKLTFDSHNYNTGNITSMKKSKKLKRFFQSKDNFTLQNKIKHSMNIRTKRKPQTCNELKSYFLLPSNVQNTKLNKNMYFYKHHLAQTIEFSSNNSDMANIQIIDDRIVPKTTMNNKQWKYKVTGNVQSTYTIIDSNASIELASHIDNINKSIRDSKDSLFACLRDNLNNVNNIIETENHQNPNNKIDNNLKVIFISDNAVTQKTLNGSIAPIDLCEVFIDDQYNRNKEKDIFNGPNNSFVFNNALRYSNEDVNESHVICETEEMSRHVQALHIDNSRNLFSDKEHNKEKRNGSLQKDSHNDNDINLVLNINSQIAIGADNITHVSQEASVKSLHLHTINNNHNILTTGNCDILINDKQGRKDIETRNDHEENEKNNNFYSYANNQSSTINHDGKSSQTLNETEKRSHHFPIVDNNQSLHIENPKNLIEFEEISHLKAGNQSKAKEDLEVCFNTVPNRNEHEHHIVSNNFKLQNRHSFVPKGMSPIFQNCQTKNICSYSLEMDYFQDDLYHNFANDVLDNFKTFENRIINMNDIGNGKINNDHNCLKFNAKSLKNAKVFGQVDRKFIVAKLQSDDFNTEHLVLFDQHAVHERIRLEDNLSDYKDGDQWNSINCETLCIKLAKDNVLYLNNFRDKFKQLGLEWKIQNECEITINAIPKAIFGKHCRQADIIMKSIKDLILEEIKAIKSLGGNTIFYPKSIMDLVFSEACRYAIKFGDKLSKRDCATLISSLSNCKTPFQCAHGRPVMAVLSDLKTVHNEYQVDKAKILTFRNKWIK